MTTATGFEVTSAGTAATRASSDNVDEASDASLFCAQDPLPTPRAAPRPRPPHHHPPTPKPRSVLPSATSVSSTTSASASASAATHPRSKLGDTLKLPEDMEPHTTPRSKQRLIKVDFSLLQDDDTFFDESCLAPAATSGRPANVGVCSQPKMPPYPIGGYMVHDAMTMTSATKATPAPQPPPPAPLTTRVTRRTSI